MQYDCTQIRFLCKSDSKLSLTPCILAWGFLMLKFNSIRRYYNAHPQQTVPCQQLLSEREQELLTRNAKKAGHNKSAYLRSLIRGIVPREQPSPQFYDLIAELRAIGNNLNQIAAKANATGHIATDMYIAEAAKLRDAVLQIKTAVLQPDKGNANGHHKNMEC